MNLFFPNSYPLDYLVIDLSSWERYFSCHFVTCTTLYTCRSRITHYSQKCVPLIFSLVLFLFSFFLFFLSPLSLMRVLSSFCSLYHKQTWVLSSHSLPLRSYGIRASSKFIFESLFNASSELHFDASLEDEEVEARLDASSKFFSVVRALLPHGEQQCNIEIRNYYEEAQHFTVRYNLNSETTLKSKVGNCEKCWASLQQFTISNFSVIHEFRLHYIVKC